jgi:hypothetical protein
LALDTTVHGLSKIRSFVRMVASDDDSGDTPDEEGPSASLPLDLASDGF